jgi:hypothetical protein
MEASRPVVASPVGVNSDAVKEDGSGFFAITEEEWIANLERFRVNTSPTSAPGGAARQTVEDSFSNPIWRAPPRQTTPHHPDKQDESRASGRRRELDGVRRGRVEMLGEQRIAGDDLSRDPAEQRGTGPNDHREAFEQRNDDGSSSHDEWDADGKTEHQERVASA